MFLINGIYKINTKNSEEPSLSETLQKIYSPLPDTPATTPPRQPQPKLCLNMIVKNEARIIERFLDSVIDYIDAYLICDTGSTDNTQNIISAYFQRHDTIKGELINHPFENFGKTRSFALQKCRELINPQYILLLDADMVWQPTIPPKDFCRVLLDENRHQNPQKINLFYIYQGSNTFNSKNVRIIEAHPDISYWGVTHEYVNCPQENANYITLKNPDVFINDIGDGGSKADKFKRDIELLKAGLDENPDNDRYTFYLANSLKDSGQNEEAIVYYKKRIELGGWFEEVWLSYFSMGECYKHLGDMSNALFAWNGAYNFHSGRLENLYKIINYYRLNGNNRLAYAYYSVADNERKNNKKINNAEDYVFKQKDVYEYKLDYELTIVGYYCNYLNYDLAATSMKVLNTAYIEQHTRNNIFSNYKFYATSICSAETPIPLVTTSSTENKQVRFDLNFKKTNLEILKNIGTELINKITIKRKTTDTTHNFVSSSPSLAKITINNRKYLAVNVRFVNYKINEDTGNYENREHIESINVFALININKSLWVNEKMFVLKYNKKHDNKYVGLEDVRLLSYQCNKPPATAFDKSTNILTVHITKNTPLFYNCNRGLKNGKMRVEKGAINLERESTEYNVILDDDNDDDDYNDDDNDNIAVPQQSNNNSAYFHETDITKMATNNFKLNDIEKNWVFFMLSPDNTKCIYSWSPLIIGDVGTHFIKTHEIETPACFKGLRGSTNGIIIGDDIWFVCHYVSYEDRRYYYHIIVVLDTTTFEVRRYTKFFTFSGAKVEYCLGFLFFEDTHEFLFSFSTNDNTSNYEYISRYKIEELFYNECENTNTI